jgi:hypothetical protein
MAVPAPFARNANHSASVDHIAANISLLIAPPMNSDSGKKATKAAAASGPPYQKGQIALRAYRRRKHPPGDDH